MHGRRHTGHGIHRAFLGRCDAPVHGLWQYREARVQTSFAPQTVQIGKPPGPRGKYPTSTRR